MANNLRRGVEKEVSVGDELFFNRIISRDSSFDSSSRIYYRSSEGIPFNWEMQPGTPKHPHKQDVLLPPIGPPPALLSLGLPKPCINVEEPKRSMKLWFKFWKKGKRSHANKKLDQAGSKGNNLGVKAESDKYSHYEMFSSDDGEFVASPPLSSSSSSSSFAFLHGLSFGSSRLPWLSRRNDSSVDRHYGCSPLNFSSVVGMSRLRQL